MTELITLTRDEFDDRLDRVEWEEGRIAAGDAAGAGRLVGIARDFAREARRLGEALGEIRLCAEDRSLTRQAILDVFARLDSERDRR